MSTKRIDITLDVLTQESTEFTNDPADCIKVIRRIEQDNVKEITRLVMQVLGGGTVETVPLPDAFAHYVIIYSDRTLSLTINGADTPFNLIPKVEGTKAPVFYAKGSFIELIVQNSGTETANVDIILAKL